MVALGVNPKTAQKRLGHADVRTTLEIYTKATDDADREAATLLGQEFMRPAATADKAAGGDGDSTPAADRQVVRWWPDEDPLVSSGRCASGVAGRAAYGRGFTRRRTPPVECGCGMNADAVPGDLSANV